MIKQGATLAVGCSVVAISWYEAVHDALARKRVPRAETVLVDGLTDAAGV
jgi:hypothetical protein